MRLIDASKLNIPIGMVEYVDGKKMVALEDMMQFIQDADTEYTDEKKELEIIGSLVDTGEVLKKMDETGIPDEYKNIFEYNIIRRCKRYNADLKELGIDIVNKNKNINRKKAEEAIRSLYVDEKINDLIKSCEKNSNKAFIYMSDIDITENE